MTLSTRKRDNRRMRERERVCVLFLHWERSEKRGW